MKLLDEVYGTVSVSPAESNVLQNFLLNRLRVDLCDEPARRSADHSTMITPPYHSNEMMSATTHFVRVIGDASP